MEPVEIFERQRREEAHRKRLRECSPRLAEALRVAHERLGHGDRLDPAGPSDVEIVRELVESVEWWDR